MIGREGGVNGAGYTLIEIIVVTAMIAILAGLTFPRLYSLYSSWQRSLQRSEVIDQVNSLSVKALLNGQAYLISNMPEDNRQLPIVLPPGWQIKADLAINFRENGVCEGGLLIIEDQLVRESFRLQPPYCAIVE